MADSFSRLERNVLKIKGATDAQIDAMGDAGINSRADLATVGDAATLSALVPGLKPALAEIVISWGLGRPVSAAALAAASTASSAAGGGPVLLAPSPASASASAAAPSAGSSGSAKTTLVLEVPEIVCTHCKTKQPKGRRSDDMCVSCGQRPTPSEGAANDTRPPR